QAPCQAGQPSGWPPPFGKARLLFPRKGHMRPVGRSLSRRSGRAPLKLSPPRGAPRDARVAGTPLRGPITTAAGIWVPAFAAELGFTQVRPLIILAEVG